MYNSDEEEQAPNTFTCPIRGFIMRNPVQLSDGHTYEHKYISKWLKRSNKSPKTGMDLPNTTMTPNYSLKTMIQDGMNDFQRNMNA